MFTIDRDTLATVVKLFYAFVWQEKVFSLHFCWLATFQGETFCVLGFNIDFLFV